MATKATKKNAPLKVASHRVKAVLKPSPQINDYLINAKGSYKSLGSTTTTWFPASALSIPLATFLTDINLLDSLQTAVHTKPPTATIAQRNDAKVIVDADQIKLLADVQKIADNNPKNAISIIKASGFQVEHAHGHNKSTGPKNTNIKGQVVITAPEAGHHEWAQLAPDGVSWISLRASTGDKKTVSGLTIGLSITFRSAPILPEKDGEAPWTVYEPITIT